MIKRRIFSFLFAIVLIFSFFIPFASAESALQFTDILSLNKSDLPFSTSSPWCVRFARWISETVYDFPSQSLSPSDSCSGSIKWFSLMGVHLTDFPSIGSWVYFDWDDDGIPDHVGVVTWSDGYNIKSIEGNVNDSIFERSFALDDNFVFGFNDPSYLASYSPSRFNRFASLSSVASPNVVSPVAPSQASGFKAVLLGLIGNYDSIVTEHRYTNSNGYTSVTIDIQPDYVWWASVGLLGLVIFCLFRLIGGWSKRG